MKHKKYWVSAAVVALVGVSSPALAAELDNASGQSCGEAIGVWHFVNNQTGGESTPGTLTASFSDGTTWTVQAYDVNKNMQHFEVESAGTLVHATTNLEGKLVLSDFTCEEEKKDDGKK